MSNFDSIFADIFEINTPDPSGGSGGLQSKNGPYFNSNEDSDLNFQIIREVLSMLNGLNVETVKKNPSDIFMLLKYRNDPGGSGGQHNSDSNNNNQLGDECCQLIIRIGGLGKILLKIINYLNYYNTSRRDSLFAYPIFDDDIEKKTLGNIKQFFIQSIHNEIKEYHYHLLMIESKFRSLNVHYSYALRRILLWSSQWLDKFIFLSDALKSCLDSKGVLLLNNVYDFSRNGDPMIRQMSRSILHQVLKPFIFNIFDWLLYGEIGPEIDQDFFIKIRENMLDDPSALSNNTTSIKTSESTTNVNEMSADCYEWRTYELNQNMLPCFMTKLQIKKIYFIGNAIRLLRDMVKEEYDQKMVYEIFNRSTIQVNYDLIKKFLYNNVESYNIEDKFYFEHNLVDDFDQLLDSYYDVINEEMFKILNLSELRSQFKCLLAYVLIQRGDFYESLFDYMLPLFRKSASEVINIVHGSCTNLYRIFNLFMVNAKLLELNQVYKIDSLLYNQFDLNDNLSFTFNKNILKHQLGWDIFLVKYRFSKKIYRTLFESKSYRYEKLFRQLFHYKRVLFSLRQAQHQIMHYYFVFKSKRLLEKIYSTNNNNANNNNQTDPSDLFKSINQMLNILHFLFFHMFGFASKMYQYFGSQVNCAWTAMFGREFGRKQKNIEKFIRTHEKFLHSVETIVFFCPNLPLMTAYSALNDSIIDFCEGFCEDELFPTMSKIVEQFKQNTDDNKPSRHSPIMHNSNSVSSSSISSSSSSSISSSSRSRSSESPQPRHNQSLDSLFETLFRHKFKITINISKYRCCISNFIELSQQTNLPFKFDILNYQPCLDSLFQVCHNSPNSSTNNKSTNDTDSSLPPTKP